MAGSHTSPPDGPSAFGNNPFGGLINRTGLEKNSQP